MSAYDDCMHELNGLKDLILGMKDNCKYMGKDSDGSIINSFEPGYDASLAFERAISHIKVIESFLKEHTEPPKTNETVKLLTWLDEHPATMNRLAVITTKSGTNIQLWNKDPNPGDGITWNKNTVSSSNDTEEKQASYTIEELQKEWNAYVFVLNDGGPRNCNGELTGFRNFIEFLQIPHTVFYADDAIYAVKFNDVLDDKKE